MILFPIIRRQSMTAEQERNALVTHISIDEAWQVPEDWFGPEEKAILRLLKR